MSPLTIKLAIAGAILAAFGAGCFYLGGLKGQAALARLQRDQAQITATAVLNERAAAEEQAAKDHITEQTHAATILQIDSAPAITAPLIVYHTAPTAGCPVSGAQRETSSVSADSQGRRSEPVDRGSNIRPGVEALKKRLEKVMADYREMDQEWQK